jgi:hypothetical protein
VPPRDVEALAAKLREILTGDRRHWQEIARAGQRTVQKAYTWDSHARRLIEIYERVIEYKARPADATAPEMIDQTRWSLTASGAKGG